MACRVTVEAPHRHHRDGNEFRVRIDLSVPGRDVVVGRSPPHHAHTDVYVAIKDAFRAARREVMDQLRLRRGNVKEHVPVPTGRVARIFDEPNGRYGFLETDDGRDVYFHEHALLDGWDDLAVGARVRFVEEVGDKGPQASTVEIVAAASP